MTIHQEQSKPEHTGEGPGPDQPTSLLEVSRAMHWLLRDLRNEIESGEAELAEDGSRVATDPEALDKRIREWNAQPGKISKRSHLALAEILGPNPSEEAMATLASGLLTSFYDKSLEIMRESGPLDTSPANVLERAIAAAYAAMLHGMAPSIPVEEVLLNLMRLTESFVSKSIRLLSGRQGSIQRTSAGELKERASAIVREGERAGCLDASEGAPAVRLLLRAASNETAMRLALAEWCHGIIDMAWESGAPEEDRAYSIARVFNRMAAAFNHPGIKFETKVDECDEPVMQPLVPLGQCLDLLVEHGDESVLDDFERNLRDFWRGRIDEEEFAAVLLRARAGLDEMENQMSLHGVSTRAMERSVVLGFKRLEEKFSVDPGAAYAELMSELNPHWRESVSQTVWRLMKETFWGMFRRPRK